MRAWWIIVLLAAVSLPLGAQSFSLPDKADIIANYSEETARAGFDSRSAQPIEGIWRYPDEMMTVCIERFAVPSTNIEYRVVLLDSDESLLLPGTVIGYAAQGAKANEFQMWLYSEHSDLLLVNPQRCLAELSGDYATLMIKPTELKVRLRINFARFLPSVFKGVSVIPSIDNPSPSRGMRKIYPAADENGTQWQGIRYL